MLTKRFGFLQPSTEDEAPEAAKVTAAAAATTPTKVPKSVSDKKRFFESAMEDQHKPTQKTGECGRVLKGGVKMGKCEGENGCRLA